MFITAAKIAIVEALVAGFNALNPSGTPNITGQFNYPQDTTLDLTPNSVTIEYPMEEIQWPAIFVQFRPSITKWSGLYPDIYTAISGATISGSQAQAASRTGYYEANIDLQILALRSEERDRLQDAIYNLVLMNPGNPGSQAFYSSLRQNNLIGITLLPGTVNTLGDTVAPGTPFSPEELSYESTLRIQCVGDFYESKFAYNLPSITAVTISGTMVFQPFSSYPNSQN